MEIPPVRERITVARADPAGAEATRLLAEMCTELTRRYGRPPSPFTVEEAKAPRACLVVAQLDGEAVGCGALRGVDAGTVEIKRMYVAPAARRRGVAKRMLAQLEQAARDFQYERVILATGNFQPEAVALYAASGYERAANYGRYVGNPERFCFEKMLAHRL